ncbi:MAG: 50S ribosomal protein L9 [Candidatus Giovannonibacteria bacterium GW2011_GWA2_53_7]|uniref:Large ribosomal subunit protein bL9 n=1 Tax=Candidatus Giovannonibacteria bacterium GW2011_GWA2_53_7 TaxID=1618650 RepID=A0A0G1XUZ4_9BACT|nr:MAG: 50S ribosomal protein L9 [Candidatus Giovannonibacteria bacterium GW2011_GWA2_53_7]
MKIILLQEVRKIGRRHEEKIVADGYGRNYLLARKLAILATPENLKKLNAWRARQSGEDKLQIELLERGLSQLTGVVVTIQAKANAEGHLFAGLHRETVVEALQKQKHLALPADTLQLEQPIKTIGDHQIAVKVGEMTGQFILRVEAIET